MLTLESLFKWSVNRVGNDLRVSGVTFFLMSHSKVAVIPAACWCLSSHFPMTFPKTETTTSNLLLSEFHVRLFVFYFLFHSSQSTFRNLLQRDKSSENEFRLAALNAARDRFAGGKSCSFSVMILWNTLQDLCRYKKKECWLNSTSKVKPCRRGNCYIKSDYNWLQSLHIRVTSHNTASVIMWLIVFIRSLSTVRGCEHHLVSHVAVLNTYIRVGVHTRAQW